MIPDLMVQVETDEERTLTSTPHLVVETGRVTDGTASLTFGEVDAPVDIDALLG